MIVAACFTACAHNNTNTANGKKKAVVVFFSATGTTKAVAEKIAAQAHADLVEITPVKHYTSADLDWTNKQSRSSVEMHDLKFRPAIKASTKKMATYDIVFLGYPIWWNLAPTAVNTFIEKNGLSGKTVVPFATSGGSTIKNSVAQFKKQYPKIKWAEGVLLNSPSTSTIRQFVEKNTK